MSCWLSFNLFLATQSYTRKMVTLGQPALTRTMSRGNRTLSSSTFHSLSLNL